VRLVVHNPATVVSDQLLLIKLDAILDLDAARRRGRLRELPISRSRLLR
jgi:hypothetical protein